MTFEDLEAWQAARRLVRQIYLVTKSNDLARDFGLCSQIQRSAVSIMSNVAEGFERVHLAEKLQFYNIARASTGETRSLLYVVEDNYPEAAAAAIAAARASGCCRQAGQRPSFDATEQRKMLG